MWVARTEPPAHTFGQNCNAAKNSHCHFSFSFSTESVKVELLCVHVARSELLEFYLKHVFEGFLRAWGVVNLKHSKNRERPYCNQVLGLFWFCFFK